MAKAGKRHKVGLGLLGSGTVGEALQDFIFKEFKGKVGADLELEIRKIYTRHPKGKKWHSSRGPLFTTKAQEVLDHPDVDIVIEALGFQDPKEVEIFRDYIIEAFRNGKSVVTSDKAVLASYGREIWSAAERYGQEIRFEACVGGGIPIIRSLSESLAVEEPEAVFGIVNGTCNYILSEMKKSAKSYGDALAEAQAKGYAETNPQSDVSGMDAEAKLILLAAVTFGLHLKPGAMWRKGIQEIDAIDFMYAERKGDCTIKHLAVARDNGGSIESFVSPALVAQGHFLAGVDGATNAIFFKGKRSAAVPASAGTRMRDWDYVFAGPGAGGGPTGIAILGDVCELARGQRRRSPALPSLKVPGSAKVQAEHDIDGNFYVRFVVKDRAGIVGDIGRIFGRAGIHISEIWQLSHGRSELLELARNSGIKAKPEQMLPFVMTLERAKLGQIRTALKIIRKQDYILIDPVWFPIWEIK